MEVTQFPEVSYKNEFELVAFRHRFFTNADKTSAKYLKIHANTIKYQANQFYQKKRSMCEIVGYELNDIVSYCQIWCINLFGKLFKEACHKSFIEQQKILHYYLRQELSRFATLLFKKGRDTMVDYIDSEYSYNYDIVNHNSTIDFNECVSKLSHSDFLKKINYVLCNPKTDSSLKELALKLLSNHKINCKVCKRATKKLSN